MRKIKNSLRHQALVDETIAHGSLTNSKHPKTFVSGVYPTAVERGLHCYLFDIDNHRYIDFICGLGTNLFGYANPTIADAVYGAMATGGAVFSLASVDELVFGQKLQGTFPWLERMRFLKTGSEGCSAAVKIARAFTGRDIVLSEGYHGWADGFVSLTTPAKGVRGDFRIEKLSDTSLSRFGTSVAAVIVEPVMLDYSPQRVEWLQQLVETCAKLGIVLIFDETITAYRFKDGSVARATGIYPDLWVGGKAVAGGLPLSIVGGRRDIMESDYFVSSTWAGDRVAIAAASAAIHLIKTTRFLPNVLWDMGNEFLTQFNKISPNVQIEGYATRGSFVANPIFKALFWQECVKAGVLFGPSWFYNAHLHEEMDNVISIAKSAISRIEDGKVKLEGEMPLSPFAQKVREEK